MKLAIMQPYFFPYIGYFQLISSAELFIVYDNIKYTKKGWISRNKILQNGGNVVFSLMLKHDSDYLDICARELALDFRPKKLINQLVGAYRKAPYYDQAIFLIEQILSENEANLFKYLYNSIIKICTYLGINTQIVISSTVEIDCSLKNQDKVIALCRAVGASTYINPIGGYELYSKDTFHKNKINLKFIKSNPICYRQFQHEFVPFLSIIDVIMFNSVEEIQKSFLSNYELI